MQVSRGVACVMSLYPSIIGRLMYIFPSTLHLNQVEESQRLLDPKSLLLGNLYP